MAGVHLSSFEVFLLYRYVSYIGRDRSHDGFGQVPAVAVEFISELQVLRGQSRLPTVDETTTIQPSTGKKMN